MKYKTFIAIILLLSLIGNGIMAFYLTKKPTKTHIEIVKTRIDTLYLEKEILLTKVNQSEITLNAIEKKYKEDYNCLINESVDSDYMFFVNYLNLQRERGLFDSNYRNSVKGN